MTGDLPALVLIEGYDCVASASKFVYKSQSTEEYLSAALGQEIAGRKVVIPELDLFKQPLAATSLHVVRNGGLASPFVYTTPNVSFSDPLRASIDSSTVFSIAGEEKRSLPAHLQALFELLLKDNSQLVPAIGVAVEYEYAVAGSVIARIPVAIQPPALISVADATADWSAQIAAWFAHVRPELSGGVLWFDLVLANLRLRSLKLPIAYIDGS